MFITRTRIRKIATDASTPEAPQPLTPPTVFRTGPQGTVLQTIEEAMAAVPAGQRPDPSDYWRYELQWEVTAHVVPTIRGVRPYAEGTRSVFLVFDVDAHASEGGPVIAQTTFISEFTTRRVRDEVAEIRQQVENWLLSTSLAGRFGDQRDLSIQTTQTDPLGLLARVGTPQPRTIAGVWRA